MSLPRSSCPAARSAAAPKPVLIAIAHGLLAAALWLALGLAAAAHAQSGSFADPPARVARISNVGGTVWLYSPDAGEWVGAARNRPLTSGDRLATDAGAYAELQLGSTTLRLAANTEFEVRTLDDEHFSVQLARGSVAVRLRDSAEAAEFELVTDDGRFVTQRAGRYRFDRDATGSYATVYDGQARYEGPNSGLALPVGQRSEFWIDAGGVAQYRVGDPLNDSFAAWLTTRERPAEQATALRYVSPAMTGAQELDRYGRWEDDAEHGVLWIPRSVPVGWAPYSAGYWAWVQPWGWTWVDDAPWGFAPFHYGRWVNRRDTWCWTPGQRVARPIYAPALVGWVGGPGLNVSISIGSDRPRAPLVGWFPLAPREVYVPSYRTSPLYAQNINVTNVQNVTQIVNVINNPQAPREFYNRRFPQAVTVVPTSVMTARQPVAPAAAQWRDAPGRRDFDRLPATAPVLTAAPVTAPQPPARATQESVRRAPGAAPLPGAAPRFGGRQESPHDGDVVRPAAPSVIVPTPRPGIAAAPTATPAPPAAPVTVNPPRVKPIPQTLPPVRDAAEPAVPAPPVSAQPPRRPMSEGGDERGRGPRVSPSATTTTPSPLAPPATAAVPPRPAAPPQVTPARAPQPTVVQEFPTMRPLPVQRGDDRRSAPPQPPAPVAPMPPVAPIPRAVELPRPVIAPAPAPREPRGDERQNEKRGEPRERDSR